MGARDSRAGERIQYPQPLAACVCPSWFATRERTPRVRGRRAAAHTRCGVTAWQRVSGGWRRVRDAGRRAAASIRPSGATENAASALSKSTPLSQRSGYAGCPPGKFSNPVNISSAARHERGSLARAAAPPRRRSSLADAAADRRERRRPSLLIRVEIEAKPVVWCDAETVAEAERLADWLSSRYEDLLEEALLASGRLGEGP